MNEIALVFGYALVVLYLFYLSYDLMGKPRNTVEKTVLSWLQPQDIAIFLRILAMWSVIGGLGLLALMAQTTPYETFFDVIFTVGLYANGGLTLIYVVLYFMFQISTRIEDASRWKYAK